MINRYEEAKKKIALYLLPIDGLDAYSHDNISDEVLMKIVEYKFGDWFNRYWNVRRWVRDRKLNKDGSINKPGIQWMIIVSKIRPRLSEFRFNITELLYCRRFRTAVGWTFHCAFEDFASQATQDSEYIFWPGNLTCDLDRIDRWINRAIIISKRGFKRPGWKRER